MFLFADIEAECQDDYMKIRVGFNGTFKGLVYSAGELENLQKIGMRLAIKRRKRHVDTPTLAKVTNFQSDGTS